MDLEGLHSRGYIDRHRPLWWDYDYKPEPREEVPLKTFLERVVVVRAEGPKGAEISLPLYTGSAVPITCLDVDLYGSPVSLFATARPYTPEELGVATRFGDMPALAFGMSLLGGAAPPKQSDVWPAENLRETMHQRGMPIKAHFRPHIRGIVKERRANHLFWYPMQNAEVCEAIETALGEFSKVFIPWIYPTDRSYTWFGCEWHSKVGADSTSGESTYRSTTRELAGAGRHMISWKRHHKVWVPKRQEVAYDEFVRGCDGGEDLFSVYPVSVDDVTGVIPLALATKTHKESRRRGPVVLGVFGHARELTMPDFPGASRESPEVFRYFIHPIRDRGLCQEAGRKISTELGVDFGVVWDSGGEYKIVRG